MVQIKQGFRPGKVGILPPDASLEHAGTLVKDSAMILPEQNQ